MCSEEELGRMDADGYNVVEGEVAAGQTKAQIMRLVSGAHHAWADYADCEECLSCLYLAPTRGPQHP